eukprot:145931-Amorphochlora_amoeboformis.AAC.1
MNLNITRGFVGAAVREGLWTVGYLSIPPQVRNFMRTKMPDTFNSDDKARVPAALTGALFACYLTHPFDTIKTCMQGMSTTQWSQNRKLSMNCAFFCILGDIERKTYGTFTDTTKKIYTNR